MTQTVLTPDHISVMVTLAAFGGLSAFWRGVEWALGHLAGMAALTLV